MNFKLVIFLYYFQFDLVCDKAIYVSMATSMIFLGFLLGGITVGPFADKLGRRITIYSYGCIIALFSLLSAFPHAYWLFVVFRFLVGFGVGKWRIYDKNLLFLFYAPVKIPNFLYCILYLPLQYFLHFMPFHSSPDPLFYFPNLPPLLFLLFDPTLPTLLLLLIPTYTLFVSPSSSLSLSILPPSPLFPLLMGIMEIRT